jgi:outer membrane receptor protein involved in Fe transport
MVPGHALHALACIAFATAVVALPPEAAAQAGNTIALEEIIVSARRIDERLLDVPVSVTVLGGATLDEFAVIRWDDLNLPGLMIGPGGLTDSLSIRGIGSGINFGFEQSAPVFIDGVWFGSSRASRIGFVDTERVEILKGPQPTFFGKNVIAGAFGVVSRKPQPEFHASLDVYQEFEHDEIAIGGVINVPLGERFAARLAGRWRDMEGFMTNSETGRKTPQMEDELARLSLRWTPTEALTLDGKLEYSKNETNGREVQYVRCVPQAFTNPRLLNPAFEDCRMDDVRGFRYDRAAFGAAMELFEDPDRPGERYDNELLSGLVRAVWRSGGGYTASLDVAYYDQDFHAEVKQDISWNQRALAAFEDSTRLFSQELRLASPDGGRWFWTAGAYHEEVARDNAPFTQMALPGGVALVTDTLLDNDAWAVFGELGLRVRDSLTLRVGGRYTDASGAIDSSRATYAISPGPLAPGADPFSYAVPVAVTQVASIATVQSRGDSDFTPAVTLEWRPRAGQLYYLSWREGFKAGGFNSFLGGPIDEIGFDPESVDYWETGLKLESAGGGARVGAALFQGDYEDLQLTIVDSNSGQGVIRNAGGARSRGLELDGAWAFVEHWEVGAALTLLDAEYTDFENASCYPTPAQTIAEGCVRTGGAPLPPDATLCQGRPGVICTQDMTGFATSFAPEWSGSLSLRYRRPLDPSWLGRPLDVSAELALMVTDEFYTTVNGAPGSVQESYAKLDARVAVSGADGRWELALVGRNLTDEIYGLWYEPLPGGGLNTGWFTTTARPRQLGAQLTLKF